MAAAEFPGAREDLTCPDCGGAMLFVPNAWRPGTMHYCCEKGCCSHGAHPDGTPLGTPANQATRRARGRAHAAFDRLWKGPEAWLGRKDAYWLMQELMGMSASEAHIGRFTQEQCEELVAKLQAPRQRRR